MPAPSSPTNFQWFVTLAKFCHLRTPSCLASSRPDGYCIDEGADRIYMSWNWRRGGWKGRGEGNWEGKILCTLRELQEGNKGQELGGGDLPTLHLFIDITIQGTLFNNICI